MTPDALGIILAVIAVNLIAAFAAFQHRPRKAPVCKSCGLLGDLKRGVCDFCRKHHHHR